MIHFKQIIAEKIKENIEEVEIESIINLIEVPKDTQNGDYSFPCFSLAKVFKKSPQIIAEELKKKIELGKEIIKIDVVNGYLNFYINKSILAKEVTEKIYHEKENYGNSDIGKGKNVVIDYSAPNIAKPFHIGHLRSTVIGGSLYKVYKTLGYNVIGVNHVGDYGTQFGKLIEGYKRWGNEYDIDNNPIEELTKIYIRINDLCKEDESVLNECRNNFKKLEDKDPYCVELWKKFRKVSLQEFQKVYDMLGIEFDSWDGEAFYTDKMDEVIKKLEKTGKLVESEGAKIIDLEEKNMAPCIIEKTNGSTTYATRDLAAILYRARTYDFDKDIYVVSYEQILHFKQVFETAKLLGLDEKYTKGLIHVPFGMVQLQTGKMSTRQGNMIKLEDLLNEAINKVKSIIEQKNPNLEEKEEVAKKVGIGAVIYNDLYNSRIKDEIFNWDIMLNFNGETGQYLQYIYVRTNSVLEKANYIPDINNIDINIIKDEASEILKILYNFNEILNSVVDKNEPSILARYLMNLAQQYSSFYNEYKILDDNTQIRNARLAITYMVGIVLKKGANLLGMNMPNKM